MSRAQAAYEEDVRRHPRYLDGSPRRPWDELEAHEREHWYKNPRPRKHNRLVVNEQSIRERLARGKMPMPRDWVGQPVERIRAWEEHVANFRTVAQGAEKAWEHFEFDYNGTRYRASGTPTMAADRYPRISRWHAEKQVVGPTGRQYVRREHWKPVTGQFAAKVAQLAKEKHREQTQPARG